MVMASLIKPRWARARELERRRHMQRVQRWVRERVTVGYQLNDAAEKSLSNGRLMLDLAGIDYRTRALQLRDQFLTDIKDAEQAEAQAAAEAARG